jgi:tetratricopeptide (TPR) repeat protein
MIETYHIERREWETGLTLRCSGWRVDRATGPLEGLRTLSNPGECTAEGEDRGWALRLVRNPAHRLEVRRTPELLFIAPRGEAAPRLTLAALDPGLFTGRSALSVRPELVAEGEIRLTDEWELYQCDGMNVALAFRTDPRGGIRFCLALDDGDPKAALVRAIEELDRDLESRVKHRMRARQALIDRLSPPAEGESELPRRTVDALIAAIRPGRGGRAYPVCLSEDGERPILDTNRALFQISAWNSLDPDTARRAFLGLLDYAGPRGEFAARYDPDGDAITPDAAWPMLAATARDLLPSDDPGSFAREVFPRLVRSAGWMARHYDPEQFGYHQWMSASEAFIPEDFDSDRATPDLESFLMRDLEALMEMEKIIPPDDGPSPDFYPAYSTIRDDLQNLFWDSSAREFLSRSFAGGGKAPLPGIYSVLPLLALGGDERWAIRLREKVFRALRDLLGPFLWAAREPRAPTPEQLMTALAALRSAEPPHGLTGAAAALWTHLDRRLSRGEAFSAREAALAATLAAVLRAAPEENVHRSLIARNLDRHPAAAVAIPVAAAAALWIAASAAFHLRPALPGATNEVMHGLAHLHYMHQRYDRALALYEFLAERQPKEDATRIRMANALVKQGRLDEAEALYRGVVAKERSHPLYILNLALILYKQDRPAEARDLYENFLTHYGEDFPNEAGRARFMLTLIENEPAKS